MHNVRGLLDMGLVGLYASTNCNKNKLAYVVKSIKYKDKRKKYQSEIISELLTLVTIHHIIYIYIYICELLTLVTIHHIIYIYACVCAHVRVCVRARARVCRILRATQSPLDDHHFTINDPYYDNHNPDTNIDEKWYQERDGQD